MVSYSKVGKYTELKLGKFYIYTRIGDYRKILGFTFYKNKVGV